MSVDKEIESVESILQKLPEKEFRQVWRILYGDGGQDLEVSEKCLKLASRYKLELVKYKFNHEIEQLRPPRLIRVALFQQSLSVPLTFPIYKVKTEMYTLAMDAIKVAAKGGAKIFCLQQAWNMPYAFCSGEKMPWSEYAEKAEEGSTTKILQSLSQENNIVIISTILERDEIFEDRIWNTAVVIDNHGRVLGKQRRNHIPCVENSNEPTYYCEGDSGHPVFETEYGKIGINICYERHYPLSWFGLALNGAEIVFNPCGAGATPRRLLDKRGTFTYVEAFKFRTEIGPKELLVSETYLRNLVEIGEEAELLWGIEARDAAIANGFYVCTVNRIGMEIYDHEYEDEEGNLIRHKDSGLFFGSSYVAAPNGTRSPGLSRTKNGLLITEFDLNLCRQIKDSRGLGVTHKLPTYRDLLLRATNSDFKPQVIKKHCHCNST